MHQNFVRAAAETWTEIVRTCDKARGDSLAERLGRLNERTINGFIRQLLYLITLPDAPSEFIAIAQHLEDNGVVGKVTADTLVYLDRLMRNRKTSNPFRNNCHCRSHSELTETWSAFFLLKIRDPCPEV